MTKISAVIPDDLGAALKECAQAEDRSVGSIVRRALAEHVLRPVAPIELRHADAAVEPRVGRDSGEER